MTIQIDKKEFELLLEYDQIEKNIRLIGIQINVAYEKRLPVFISVLNGSFMFAADLLKEIEIGCEISFVKLASYQGERQSEQIKNLIGLNMSLQDREVIILEDIVESGNTLKQVIELVKKEKPASVAVCTLLLKPAALQHDFDEIAYVGFEIENEFVVGYGLDYNGLGRNLKDIYRLKREIP
ncbi:hypoxanthine phosphoribosyltransferase [Olivibacter sitiensis]|uniref:hypoxanthine phosphoribosyltransferase n=1 Tax=Olivibacter sitiensis TaxID=376470 RepID=UPI0004238996|nr:hypoxanthine phosphoribosyltransferase [Olivibacter sitiensis]